MAGWVDIEEVAGDELERAFYGQATVDEAISAMISRTLPFFAARKADPGPGGPLMIGAP